MQSINPGQNEPGRHTAQPGAPANRINTVAGFVSDTHPAFVLQFWPTDLAKPRAHIVFLPPFAEEMNRCRLLVSSQARQFAREGYSCSIIDFYGTGESQGDLCDASLPIWRQNIDDLLQQLLQRSQCPVYLWGCRLGALLALDYMSVRPGACEKLILWQPVSSGGTFVTQLLRQRSAAMMQKGEKSESTAEMKQQLAQGKSIEVAGYSLGGELLSGIDQLEVASMLQSMSQSGAFDKKPDIYWFEHTDEDNNVPGAKTSRIIGELQSSGANVVLTTFVGDPVWQLNKRSSCDDLLVKTRELTL